MGGGRDQWLVARGIEERNIGGAMVERCNGGGTWRWSRTRTWRNVATVGNEERGIDAVKTWTNEMQLQVDG